jgi:hypothetical protein
VRLTRSSLLSSILVALGALCLTIGLTADDKKATKSKPALNANAKPFVPKGVMSTDEDEATEAEASEKPTKEQEVPLEAKLKVFTEESFIAKHIATSQDEAFKVTKRRDTEKDWPKKSTSAKNTVIRLDETTLEALTKAHTHGTKNLCAIEVAAWQCPKGVTKATMCKLDEHTWVGIQYHSKKSAKTTAGATGEGMMYHVAAAAGKPVCELK